MGPVMVGRRLTQRNGAFAIEYAVLMAVVAAALIGMSVYTFRALCGRWRQVGDVFGQGRQYEPSRTLCSGNGCI